MYVSTTQNKENIMITFKTREAWLQAAANTFRETLFTPNSYTCPPIQISVGWPAGSRGGSKYKAIGQCWSNKAAADNLHHIFISPEIDNPKRVLDILIHEMAHATVGISEGHNKVFRKCALKVGLTGKMTATIATDELNTQLDSIINTYLGEFPHGKLSAEDRPKPKQKSRMIKVACLNNCTDLSVRLARKWIDLDLCPRCPECKESMIEV